MGAQKAFTKVDICVEGSKDGCVVAEHVIEKTEQSVLGPVDEDRLVG